MLPSWRGCGTISGTCHQEKGLRGRGDEQSVSGEDKRGQI